jgi:4-amino-4-deoxy-L-arabinose transferase-like glycosyltransferase
VLRRDQREKAYEAHQPPLYYLLGTPIWAATRGLPEETRAAVLRLLSTLLGAVGVLLIYRLGRIVTPAEEALALGATAFAAFLPMRLATAAAIGNDLLAETVFSGTLVLLAGTIRYGISSGRSVGIGLMLGVGLLSKSTCLLLFPVAALGMMLAFGRRDPEGALGSSTPPPLPPSPKRRGGNPEVPDSTPPLRFGEGAGGRGLATLAAHLAGTFALALLVGGWWLARNQRLYGELFVAETFVRYFQDTARPELFMRLGYSFASYLFLLVIPLTFRSFWGVFGHMQIHMGVLTTTTPDRTPLLPPSWLYPLLLVPTVASLVGLVRAYLRREAMEERSRACWAVLVVTWLLVGAAFLRFNTAFFQAQGRYLFPAMAPIALLFVLGLQSLAPAKARPGIAWGVAGTMLALALYALFGCLVPAFR